MNKTRNWLSVLVGLALLAALVIGLSAILRSAGTVPGTGEGPYPVPGDQSTEILNGEAYPPPEVTPPVIGTEAPTPIVIEAGVGTEIALRPTVTPLPTPTPRRGPTPTPLPMGELPSDPSGEIAFAVLEGAKAIAIYALSVNEAGSLDGSPLELSSEPVPIFGGVTIAGIIRPSPDGSRLAVLNSAESGTW